MPWKYGHSIIILECSTILRYRCIDGSFSCSQWDRIDYYISLTSVDSGGSIDHIEMEIMVRTHKDIELGINGWVISCEEICGCMISYEVHIKSFLYIRWNGSTTMRVFIA